MLPSGRPWYGRWHRLSSSFGTTSASPAMKEFTLSASSIAATRRVRQFSITPCSSCKHSKCLRCSGHLGLSSGVFLQVSVNHRMTRQQPEDHLRKIA
eukprot:2023242-Amphidinium_carterae.2